MQEVNSECNFSVYKKKPAFRALFHRLSNTPLSYGNSRKELLNSIKQIGINNKFLLDLIKNYTIKKLRNFTNNLYLTPILKNNFISLFWQYFRLIFREYLQNI